MIWLFLLTIICLAFFREDFLEDPVGKFAYSVIFLIFFGFVLFFFVFILL